MSEVEEFLIRPEIRKYIEELVQAREIVDYKIDVESGTKKGDNYLGVIAKITITGKKDDKDINLHWIAKNAPQVKSFRELAGIESIYCREIYVYRELFSIFDKFQNERNILKPFVNYPKLIGTYLEPFQEVVIMEDVKFNGFTLRNRKLTLDFEHVKLVLKTYGKLHAISYAIKDQEPELFDRLKKNMVESFVNELPKEAFSAREEQFCARSLEVLDRDPTKYDLERKIFSKYKERSFDYILETLRRSYEDPYSVFGHGDSWVNNIFYKYEDKDHPDLPTELCLIDFQFSRFGSPAFDLSYFIFVSTEKSLRDQHFNDFLDIYYESLCDHLTNLGSSPEKMLPFSVLKDQMKRYSIVGYFLTQMVMHLSISDAEEVPDFSKDMAHEEYLAGLSYKSKNEDFFAKRIEGIQSDDGCIFNIVL
ncbi:hypothetical protein Trydic_g1872 [Trypoxylus dichotomus]